MLGSRNVTLTERLSNEVRDRFAGVRNLFVSRWAFSAPSIKAGRLTHARGSGRRHAPIGARCGERNFVALPFPFLSLHSFDEEFL